MALSGPPKCPEPKSMFVSPPPAPVGVSPSGFAPGFSAPTGAGFFEHPAITSTAQTLAIAIVLANVELLFTQPPRPCWTGIIAITLRQSGNYFPVADHHYIDSRAMCARRAERQLA